MQLNIRASRWELVVELRSFHSNLSRPVVEPYQGEGDGSYISMTGDTAIMKTLYTVHSAELNTVGGILMSYQ